MPASSSSLNGAPSGFATSRQALFLDADEAARRISVLHGGPNLCFEGLAVLNGGGLQIGLRRSMGPSHSLIRRPSVLAINDPGAQQQTLGRRGESHSKRVTSHTSCSTRWTSTWPAQITTTIYVCFTGVLHADIAWSLNTEQWQKCRGCHPVHGCSLQAPADRSTFEQPAALVVPLNLCALGPTEGRVKWVSSAMGSSPKLLLVIFLALVYRSSSDPAVLSSPEDIRSYLQQQVGEAWREIEERINSQGTRKLLQNPDLPALNKYGGASMEGKIIAPNWVGHPL